MFTLNVFNRKYDTFNYLDDFFNTSTSDFIHPEYPYLQIFEGENEIEVRAALPGIKAEDLNIQIKNETLTIEGEKKSDYIEKPYIRKERTFGKFEKTITLPFEVDSGKIQADLKDGVLNIRLPKSEDAKPKKVEIK